MTFVWTDPIVEEVHRIRREYAARFNGDLAAMFEDARNHQDESRKQGRVIISAHLRRAGKSAEPAA